MSLAIEVKENSRVDLGDYDPSDTAGLKKEEAAQRFTEITQELGELQEVLYAAGQNSVLIILQGMDTSGKDGTIKGVMSTRKAAASNPSKFQPQKNWRTIFYGVCIRLHRRLA